MSRREGWKETKIRITKALDGRLRCVAVARGWSLDTCARKAMKRIANKRKVKLPGGNQTEILHRAPATILSGASDKLWIGFPRSWDQGLAELVAKSDLHTQVAPLWREALLDWIEMQEWQLKRDGIEIPELYT